MARYKGKDRQRVIATIDYGFLKNVFKQCRYRLPIQGALNSKISEKLLSPAFPL